MTDPVEPTGACGTRKRVTNYGTGRVALLDAAVRVVARSGLRKLTYRAVAEEAGVTHGLVVHHFGSRDALIEAAVNHAIHSSLRVNALNTGTGTAEDFAANLGGMVAAGPDVQAFQYELLLEARRRPELMPQLRGLYEEYFDAAQRELARVLARPIDRGLSRLVFAALEGLVLHQLVFGERDVTEEALSELRALLVKLTADATDATVTDVTVTVTDATVTDATATATVTDADNTARADNAAADN
ncbi:TetR/AcrR family transcriptional regulator [Streptomyces zagrosensis]|uniref:AcrR family transcriptional regulator n=1 Tax=Streptomyces zagrosensis TaxID=1042984 RepID=A0A7W9V2H4_9ACTN|nr:TetR family transcriptional regulator [Streptomyces zagrosensis]MBB5939301.1 AcrR family transcriptional regulator [Streptomyces zagrosensis]